LRLFIDECLSPRIARDLNASGLHLAVHPLDYGGRGQADYTVLKRCIEEDLVIVTENAADFRALVAGKAIHPGLIILPCVDRKASAALLDAAITHLAALGEPMDVMVNHVLEVAADKTMRLYLLPR
jgi:predicted nuclease of predicted toxin-antitoxin system